MPVWPFGRRPRRHSSVIIQPILVVPVEAREPVNQSVTALPSQRVSRSSSVLLPWRRGSLAKSADDKAMHGTTLEPITPVSPLDSDFDARARTPDSQASAEHITALPQSRILKTSPHLRPAHRDNADIPYDFRLQSSSSRLNTPTVSSHLHSSRKLSRSSGSKFGFNYRESAIPKDVKEEELRAMSTPAIAPRPSTRGGSGILRRETKNVRSGLTIHLTRPESRITLPRPDTGIASMVGQPDARAYRISIMDIMSPRPTIKSTEPYSMLTLGVTDSRAPSRRQMTANANELGKSSRRVNDLADILDSSGLRLAMEREHKRREKKKQADAERLRRRLERRAQEQRDEDSEPPLPSPAYTRAVLTEAAAAVAVSRKRSRRRKREQSRRRSSSASRPDTGRRRRDEEAQSQIPVPPRPEEFSEAPTPVVVSPSWPKRSDSRHPPNSPLLASRAHTPLASISRTMILSNDDRPITPLSRRLNMEDSVLTPDRIVPEEDPDEAVPPSIARQRYPKHEQPLVAHIYSQRPASPSASTEPPKVKSEHLRHQQSEVGLVSAGSAVEPVMDITAIEPPADFAPTASQQTEIGFSNAPGQESHRVSPLLPDNVEDIPGLPFLSSTGSESDSQIVSPFAASFPTSFPETDFAAPAPTVHRDPLVSRGAPYSSLSPAAVDNPFGSTTSITALPQVPVPTAAPVEKSKRRRGPSAILSLFRRGDKRHGRARSASEAAADVHAESLQIDHTAAQHELVAQYFEQSTLNERHHRQSANVPQPSLTTLVRTQSRFKEDFSGLGINYLNKVRPPSPPDSNVNSPYNQYMPSSAGYMRGAIITPNSHPRFSTQSNAAGPKDKQRRRSKSLNRISNPLSKSLASIDSEGSWLTGKPVRGSSTRSAQLRNLTADSQPSGVDASGRRIVYHGLHGSTSEENLEKVGALDHFGLQPGRTLHSRQGTESHPRIAADELHANHSSRMASSEIIVPDEAADALESHGQTVKLLTDVSARLPEVKPGHSVKSSEGMLHEHRAVIGDAKQQTVSEPDTSAEEDTSAGSYLSEKKEAEIYRVISTRASPRVVSVGSTHKLLELSGDAQSRDANHDFTQ